MLAEHAEEAPTAKETVVPQAANEPDVLAAGKQVPSIWDFCAGVRSSSSRSTCTPVPTRLPLLPRLPRCEECQSVLDNGRCVDYDCCATRKSR